MYSPDFHNIILVVFNQYFSKQTLYTHLLSPFNKVKIPPTTEAEVKQAIRKLNNGKAADENGIQAEHFKFANAELATEICSITNLPIKFVVY
jgi:hypothetical protein